ncbi:MAG: WG repeat-containing protein [Bacteroides sp.]|nr:WG repeat-containing protein [Bacteroides sp.]MCM1413579.1 WG repeat-containing protein [Bacteroides sp.]MCM1471204.1 WG repeat-containing protein [Bacteroides sp.]
MNKKTSLLAMTLSVVASIFFLSSCNLLGGSDKVNVEYIPVQDHEGGDWYFVDAEGNKVGRQKWEFEPTVTIDGIFAARTDDGISVYQWEGEEAETIDGLEDLTAVGTYSEGILPIVRRLERISMVDKKGETIFTLDPIDGKEIQSCAPAFKDGMLIVTNEDGKSGVVDKKGEVVVEPAYDAISDYNEGYAMAYNHITDTTGNDTGQFIELFVLDKEGNATKVNRKYTQKVDPTNYICGIDGFTNGHSYQCFDTYSDSTASKNRYVMIATDGATKLTDKIISAPLPNGSYIETVAKPDYNDSYSLRSKDDKVVLRSKNGSLTIEGDFVINEEYNSDKNTYRLTIYNDEGEKLNSIKSSEYIRIEAPGGKFGLVKIWPAGECVIYGDDAKSVMGKKHYAIGTRTMLNYTSYEEGECGDISIYSSYIDITAAANRLSEVIAQGYMPGIKNYYLGQPFAELLADVNYEPTASQREYGIPTKDYNSLITGPGFHVYGEAESDANVLVPTYSKYFDVLYYDYYGTGWGYWRNKRTGNKINSSARIKSFDLRVYTNSPCSKELRKAIARHLKKDGFTQIESDDNYDEYRNASTAVLVYGTENSPSIGILMTKPSDMDRLSSEKKTSLVTSLL